MVWETRIYKPGARSNDWTYAILITPDGEVTGAILQVPPDEAAPALDPEVARQRADATTDRGWATTSPGSPSPRCAPSSSRRAPT